MIDVTKIILNFHKLLVAIARSLSAIGLYKGCDEWEELTENVFNILIVNHLAEKHDYSILQQYELWDQYKGELIVEVCAGSSVLIGEKNESSETYKYSEQHRIGNVIRFSFVEFGNPSLAEDDLEGLEYAEGLHEGGRVICAKKRDCKFFINS